MADLGEQIRENQRDQVQQEIARALAQLVQELKEIKQALKDLVIASRQRH